jgi:choice-of-anchor B domain-containing protein
MRLTLRLALLLGALLPAAAGAQSLNMTLVGSLDPRPQGYSDIWGYVAPNGREYAVISTRDDGGTSIIDVTASPPVEVKYLPGLGGIGSDVEIYGNYAYMSDDLRPVQIVDLSDPPNATVVATFEADPGEPTAGVHTLTVAGDYLFTQGGASPGGVRIWSLTNPVAPAYVGEYQPHYVHDIMVRGDTMYTAGIYGQGIDIVDISNPASPQMISRFNYPGSGAHNICSDATGSYVYVGDEIGSGQWTRIFDVRDPLNVTQVGDIIVDPTTTVHNCHVKGDLLFIGYYDGYGARVYDISNPAVPVEVAYYETGNGMMWSVYPHLPSGNIIGSLYSGGGLRMFRLDPIVAGEGGPTDAEALALSTAPNPMSGTARITFTLPEASDVRLALYDVTGREVALVASGTRAAGAHAVEFEAASLPQGVYIARLTAAGRVATQRVTVVG